MIRLIRKTAAVTGLTALSACVLVAPNRAATFGDGALFLQAPAGYCVDTVASRPSDDFAVLAPCATLGVRTAAPDVVGLITIKADDPGTGDIATDEIALRDFLITDAGKALLSQSGSAEDVSILSTQAFDDQVMVHFADQGAPPLDGLQDQEWRAFRNLGGRLITIGVRGLAAAPLQDGPGASLLKLVIAGFEDTIEAPAS